MNERIFQDIFDRLQEVLPADWEKLIIYISYTKGSYSMNYYTDSGDGVYIDCFNQRNIDRSQLIRLFMDIDKIVAPERKASDEKNRWSVMTMIVDADGGMEAEFDYADISERTIEYERMWKNKYLK